MSSHDCKAANGSETTVHPSSSPRIGVQDVGAYFVHDDGSLWRCITYAAEPTASLEMVASGRAESAGKQRAVGVVGSLIFEGFRRLRPEGESEWPRGVQRLVAAANAVVADAARYTDDGVPVSPSARALHDVLEEL